MTTTMNKEIFLEKTNFLNENGRISKMKKALFLGVCAVTLSPLWATPSEKPVEAVVAPQDVSKMQAEAGNFAKLEAEFKKWGVNTVWEQVRGKNSNEHGSQDVSTAYSLFADDKMMAVDEGKIVSTDPLVNGKDAATMLHINAITEALAKSTDGKVWVEYTHMEKNPADDKNMIAVKCKAFAWDERAFGIKDHKFFVFTETPAS